MRSRGAAFTHRLPASLPGHRLTFDKQGGYCTVEPTGAGGCGDGGDIVHGVVYDLDEDGFDALDVHEGAPTHYTRQHVSPTVSADSAGTAAGEAVAAMAYIAVPNMRAPGLRPRQSYLLHLLGGADLLPEDYVCTLRRQATTATDEQPAEPPEAAAWFFVYGTLRPDGDGGWTERFNAGLIGLPATLHSATLYDDRSIGYAAVVLDPDARAGNEAGGGSARLGGAGPRIRADRGPRHAGRQAGRSRPD